MRQTIYKSTLFIICLFGSILANASAASFFNFSWSGAEALQIADYKSAHKQASSDSVITDTAFHYFKLGVINTALKDESKALFYFRLTAQKSPILAPFAYEYIGDISYQQQQFQNALNAYRTSLNTPLPRKYRDVVFNKIKLIIDNDSSDLVQGPWLKEFREWLIPLIKQPATSVYDSIVAIISSGNFYKSDSTLLKSIKSDNRKCNILTFLSSNTWPDTLISSEMIFSFAQEAYECKNYNVSNLFLEKAKKRADFEKKVTLRSSLYLQAKLSYSLGQYSKAIELFKKYDKNFGSEPEILMSIARAYRKLDNDENAWKWYDKHVKLYPAHPKTQEILWLMAWRMESMDKYAEAAQYYNTIFTKSNKGSRVEESYIRYALCYYKRDLYDSTITMLNKFIKKHPISEFSLAARFWKAKSFLALDKQDSAQHYFSYISKIEPYDYYANRSRQIMQLLGDTTQYTIDTSVNLESTLRWLDSISPPNPKKILSTTDSVNLYRGIALSIIGRTDESDHFLENLEQSFPGNLSLQFKLALVYLRANASMQAYRVARRLTWRIPQEQRTSLPFLMYILFYPPFYSESIKREATIRNVDPFLVSAVIRQESIFNPKIVSHAGAIGLMQIMPFTGKDVATSLGESFTTDSLYLPLTNIRYGVAYLRQLLDQFKDNLVMAIASYNAGPHNSIKWYNRNKDEEFDLFIEDIEFTETRGYVKKVLANYWTYRFLATFPQFKYKSKLDNSALHPVQRNK
jgi:soluble lytic murein transglycosylase-like protein/outer membrane protein assembly factor BamD (BamD/ComL family)